MGKGGILGVSAFLLTPCVGPTGNQKLTSVAHCDGAYTDTRDPSRFIKTLFTVHLYLNDCKDEAGPGSDADLVGGATTFFSADEKRRMDIKPKAGRVLIFQHRRLYHSGDDVLEGTKYTMRTDIMYEFIKHESAEELVEGTVDGAAST